MHQLKSTNTAATDPLTLKCCTRHHFATPGGITHYDYIRSRYMGLLVAKIHEAAVTLFTFQQSVLDREPLWEVPLSTCLLHSIEHRSKAVTLANWVGWLCWHYIIILYSSLHSHATSAQATFFISHLDGFSYAFYVWLSLCKGMRAAILSINPSTQSAEP